MTVDDCKRLLVKLGIKHGVPPKLIYDRLLSLADKDDMLSGLVSTDTLECHVKLWKEYGMCHYTNGTGEWYSDFKLYQGIGKGSP